MEDAAAFSFTFRDGYLNSLALESLTHGVYTSVFIAAVSNMLRSRRRRRQVGLILGIATIWVLATIHLGVRWWWVRQAFIVHGDTADTILHTFLDERYRWMWGVSGVCATLGIQIADGVLIWRCWIIWSKNSRVLIVLLCTLAMTVFNGLFLWQDIGHSSGKDGLNFGLSTINWGLAFFATSLSTTVLCTSLIIYRISVISLGAGQIITLRSYRGIIEVLVESAALYALSLILFMAFFARDDPANVYPQAILISCSGIAPTLIIARVATGQARPDESWTTEPSTVTGGSLRFASDITQDIPLNITMRSEYITDSSSLHCKDGVLGKDDTSDMKRDVSRQSTLNGSRRTSQV